MAEIRRYCPHPPQLVGRISAPRKDEELQAYATRLRGEWDSAMQELQRFLKYLMDANDSGQTGSGIQGVVGGAIDHGLTLGLLDDDHPQYLKEKLYGGLAAEIPLHDHSSGTQAGTVDHGVLTGLGDDDHPQYAKQLAGVKPHTHLASDIPGFVVSVTTAAGDILASRRPAPHTHLATDIPGFIVAVTSAAGDILVSRRPLPHTHLYSDLVGAQLLVPEGTAGAPSLAIGASNTGWYRISSIYPTLTVGGTAAHLWSVASYFLLSNSSLIYFGSNSDSAIGRVGVGVLRQTSGGTDCGFQIKAGSAQTLNLQEWQNSSGTPLSRIDAGGQTTDFVLAGQIFGP